MQESPSPVPNVTPLSSSLPETRSTTLLSKPLIETMAFNAAMALV